MPIEIKMLQMKFAFMTKRLMLPGSLARECVCVRVGVCCLG